MFGKAAEVTLPCQIRICIMLYMGTGLLLLIIFALLLFLLPGVVMLRRGLMGKRIDDHPVCKACKFDLVGSPEAESCPECGADLTKPKAVRIGNRQRQTGGIVAGLILLTLALTPGISFVAINAPLLNIQKLQPTGLLIWQVKTGINTSAAINELNIRHQSLTLTPQQVQSAGDAILVFQGDLTRTWDSDAGDFIEKVYLAGALPQAKLEQYLKTAIQDPHQLVVRQQVRKGDSIPYRLVDQPMRIGTGAIQQGSTINYGHIWWLEEKQIGFTLGKVVVQRGGGSGGGLSTNASGWSGSSLSLLPHEWDKMQLGEQPIQLHRSLEVYDHQTYQQSKYSPVSSQALLTVNHTYQATFEIVDASISVVRPIADPALQMVLESAITITGLTYRSRPNSYDVLDINLKIETLPVSVAFDIFYIHWETGKEIKMTTLAAEKGYKTHLSTSYHPGRSDPFEIPDELTTLDLVLRPSADAALAHPFVTDYWDGVIWFDDVVFERVP